MAKQVEEFPPRYKHRDWTPLLDGSIWQLTRGEDFVNDPKTMRSTAIQAAKRAGLKLHTSIDGDTITIQAYDPNANG
jgi:hypothetical protein